MQQDAQQLRFATARLASGLRVRYAERGDPGGEAIVFLPAYTDSWFSYSRGPAAVAPALPRLRLGPARPRRLRAAGVLLQR
jgi:hypothetical protein